MTSKPAPQPLALPSLFASVDRAATAHQFRFFVLKATELSALALGALVGVTRADDLGALAGIIAVMCFLVAAGIRLSGAGHTAEKRWYDARAAAESIKSLSWQYAVEGEAFRSDDEKPEEVLVIRLREILHAVPHLDVPAVSAANAGVTEPMLALRRADRATQAERYRVDRIEDQITWYSREAKKNKSRSQAWSTGVVIVELGAVLAGILRARGTLDIDVLGVFGAIGAGMIAWTQAKNYTELSESYALTSHEIGLVAQSVRSDVSEEVWAQSVHDAEAAFSREHTMWLARRQSRQHH